MIDHSNNNQTIFHIYIILHIHSNIALADKQQNWDRDKD